MVKQVKKNHHYSQTILKQNINESRPANLPHTKLGRLQFSIPKYRKTSVKIGMIWHLKSKIVLSKGN